MTGKIRRTCAHPVCNRKIVAPYIMCREHWLALSPQQHRAADAIRRKHAW